MFTYEPMFKGVLNDIRPKEAHFTFLPLTWGPKIDLTLGHRNKKSEMNILCILLVLSISKSFKSDRSVGVAIAGLLTFFGGKVTWRALVTWPWTTLIWNLTSCVEKMYEQV